MMRLFRHYISASFFYLGLAEFFIWFLSVYAGMALRFWGDIESSDIYPLWPKALLIAIVMLLAMMAVGLYQRNFRDGLWGLLLRIVIGASLGLLLMTLVFYFIPALFLGRGVFSLAFAIALSGIAVTRLLFLRLVNQEALKHRVLVLGAGRKAANIEKYLRRKADRRSFQVVGYVHIPGEHDEIDVSRVIYRESPLLDLAREMDVDDIVVAVEDRRKGFPVDEILDCRMSGVEVMDILTFFESQTGRVMLDLLQPSWLIYSDGFHGGKVRALVKRLFDIAASGALLFLAWPVMLLAAAAIFIEGGCRGPVLYRQVRVGCNWQLFQVLKFRSMVVSAEPDGVARWAQKNDPRITRVGVFMRKTRIDELPQLFNVLRGDMSFVGPRPERPMFVEQLSHKIPYYAERHRVKPGVTGWAQICYPYGASEDDAAQKLQYDLYYVKNYSLFIDIMILLQTLEVILWGRGAR